MIVIYFGPITRGLWNFIKVFNPFFVGIAIAFVLNKPCMFIEKILNRKVLKQSSSNSLSRGIATAATYAIFLLILAIIVSIIIPQITQNVQILISNIGIYTHNLQAIANNVTEFLHLDKINLSSAEASFFEYIQKFESSIAGLLAQIISITAGIIFFIANLFISFIFSIYILFGKERLLGQCRSVLSTYLPENIYKKCHYVYAVAVDSFNKYIIGQVFGAIIIGLICLIGMLVFQFAYPLLISVLVGITALIPLIGPFLGGLIAFIFLLMINPAKAFWFLVFILTVHQFVGNVIFPKLIGNRLGLPSIWILLSIIIGAGLAGIMGIIFGLPVVTVLYILLRNDIRNRRGLSK